MTAIYWAISGIGWAKGETPEDAFEKYVAIQQNNFRHLTREEILDIGKGQILRAPEGAEGFVRGMGDVWTDADEKYLQDIDFSQETVAWIGAEPTWAEDREGLTDLPVMR